MFPNIIIYWMRKLIYIFLIICSQPSIKKSKQKMDVSDDILKKILKPTSIKTREVCQKFNRFHPYSKMVHAGYANHLLKSINEDKINYFHQIPIRFFRQYKNQLNWTNISYCYVSDSFIKEFQDKLDWDSVSDCQPLSEKMIIYTLIVSTGKKLI